MKAITIIQPWATLIAIEAKQYETRSWPTKHRGEIAIHAGKKIDKDACKYPEIRAALEQHGYTVDNLPTGAVVAIAKLTNCLKSVDTWTDGYELEGNRLVYSPEYEFGDFEPGRYAWETSDVKMLMKPLAANVKWLQYAGFHDESGDQVEVFEGDIVELGYEDETHTCEVKYEGSGFMFVADSLPDGYLWASEVIEFDGSYCRAEGVRVVGNVHSRQGLAPKEGADKHEPV